MDCSVMDTPAHDVPSPYLDLDSPTGIEALGYDRAADPHGGGRAARAAGEMGKAYDHLRAAVRLLQGRWSGRRAGPPAPRARRGPELSRRDSLTATYNRRYLDECLATLLNQPVDPAVRTVGLSVALVDIDHFKLVNDTYGHLLGDRVLQRLVGVLGSGLPGGAFCARFGGEEFALVLPGHGYAEAIEVCGGRPRPGGPPPVGRARDGLARHGQRGVAHCVGWPTQRWSAWARRTCCVHGQAGRSQRRGVPRRRHRVRPAGGFRRRAAVDPLLAHERTVAAGRRLNGVDGASPRRRHTPFVPDAPRFRGHTPRPAVVTTPPGV